MVDEKEEVKNEFDGLEPDEAPTQTVSEVPGGQESLVSAGNAGQVYDWQTAPEGIKAPPRIDMNDKIVTIKKADIVLPPRERKWEATKAGDKQCKFCTFVLHYDFESQQEFYSGVRVFKKDGDMYSHPTMARDRKSQASALLGKYADFRGKDINEVSLKEFMSFLNGQPKAKIATVDVKNPTNEQIVKKNLVGEFVK